jgi:hypothetical protein
MGIRGAIAVAAAKVGAFVPRAAAILPAEHAADTICAAIVSGDPSRITHLSDKVFDRVRGNPLSKEHVLAAITAAEQRLDEIDAEHAADDC